MTLVMYHKTYIEGRFVVPNKATFEYNYTVSSICTNRATVLYSYIPIRTYIAMNTATAAQIGTWL